MLSELIRDAQKNGLHKEILSESQLFDIEKRVHRRIETAKRIRSEEFPLAEFAILEDDALFLEIFSQLGREEHLVMSQKFKESNMATMKEARRIE